MTVNIQTVNIWLNGVSYPCNEFNVSAIPSIIDGKIVVYYQIGSGVNDIAVWVTDGNVTLDSVDANSTTLNDVVNMCLSQLNLTRI